MNEQTTVRYKHNYKQKAKISFHSLIENKLPTCIATYATILNEATTKYKTRYEKERKQTDAIPEKA